VKTQRTLLAIAAAIFVATLGADAPDAEETSSTLSPQALREIAQVEAEIDRIEAQTPNGLQRRRTIRSSKSSCLAS
jgi:hypothetical protein